MRRSLPPAAEIQRAAAALLEEAGQIEDAIGLLAEAEDWPSLARLIRQQVSALLAGGRGQTLLEWIARLPDGLKSSDPWLLYWHGAATLPLSPGKARPAFERAFERFREGREAAGAFLAWAAIVDTYIHECRDLRLPDRWIVLLGDLRREFPEFPSADVEARVVACMLPALY
jgi:ATP/maltotriose-dependent transcriptional regulator MalT